MMAKLYKQNPSSFGATVGPTGPVPTIQNSAIELYHLSTELLVTLKNFASGGARLWIYDIHPKRNSADQPLRSWRQGLEETQGHDAASSIIDTSYPVGTRPQDSKEFLDLWEIDFEKEIYLGPGDTHEHRSLYAPHKLIKASALYSGEDGTSEFVLHGHTRYVMVCGHGAPGMLQPGGEAIPGVNVPATEQHYVTTQAPQIGVMVQRKYKYSMLEFSPGGDIDFTGSLFAATALAVKDREEDGDEVIADAITT